MQPGAKTFRARLLQIAVQLGHWLFVLQKAQHEWALLCPTVCPVRPERNASEVEGGTAVLAMTSVKKRIDIKLLPIARIRMPRREQWPVCLRATSDETHARRESCRPRSPVCCLLPQPSPFRPA